MLVQGKPRTLSSIEEEQFFRKCLEHQFVRFTGLASYFWDAIRVQHGIVRFHMPLALSFALLWSA